MRQARGALTFVGSVGTGVVEARPWTEVMTGLTMIEEQSVPRRGPLAFQ
jgi:hypothetical protein